MKAQETKRAERQRIIDLIFSYLEHLMLVDAVDKVRTERRFKGLIAMIKKEK
jgi:hypothetical protein